MKLTSHRARRRAFTRIELLTAVVVLVAILALLVPAIQSSREKARKTECANHLKRIGLALHMYFDAAGALPPAIIHSLDSKSTPPGKAMAVTGWQLLQPFTGTVFCEMYNPNYGLLPGTSGHSDATKDQLSSNQSAVECRMTLFTCPSDNDPSLANNPEPPGICRNARKGNFLFAAGANFNPRLNGPRTPGNPDVPYNEAAPFYGELLKHKSTSLGVFGHSGAAKFDQILDGLGYTIAVGESVQDHAGGDRTAVVWSQGKLYGQMAVSDGFGVATPKFPNPPASRTTMNHREEEGGVSPAVLSSKHRNGVGLLFVDGSMRFVNQKISVSIYNTLFMIRDGADVPDSF